MMDLFVDWYCPACGLTDRTKGNPPNRMHHCPRMGGLVTSFVRAGVKAKVEAHLREDYVGHEKVQLDDAGRPVMSITTTRDDGLDVTVFAPTAVGMGETS